VNKKNKLANVAVAKARELQALIDTLNNTTVGGLSDRIDTNDLAITSLSQADTSINEALNVMNNKLNSIAASFGIVFDNTGLITSEDYLSRTHSYEDATINDTTDGTGTESVTTKTTQGVN
jgi:hypothetical protein